MLGSILGAVGGIASSLLGNSQAKKQAKLQKEFAQKGIQWKVADATAAGLHPLAALGANTISYQPQAVGVPDLGAMGANLGQDIERSRMATSGPGMRAINTGLEALTLERAGLENDLLRSQIRRMNAPGIGPPMPDLAPTTNQTMGHPDWVTKQPNLGQVSEDAYGEVGSGIIGSLAFLRDLMNNVQKRYYKPRPRSPGGGGGGGSW